jgi:hypothetical protein
LADIEKVIQVGIAGTSMIANDQLGNEQLTQLAETVIQMRRDGLRDRFEREMKAAGEEVFEEELDELAMDFTTAGPTVPIPPIGAATVESVARGRARYKEHACESCHAEDGTGAENMPLFDQQGYPVVPRSLVDEPLKGGDEPEEVFLRVLLGMPGSPHPANVISDESLIDLVHFCQSLGKEPKRSQTNHQRALRAYQRPVIDPQSDSSQ